MWFFSKGSKRFKELEEQRKKDRVEFISSIGLLPDYMMMLTKDCPECLSAGEYCGHETHLIKMHDVDETKANLIVEFTNWTALRYESLFDEDLASLVHVGLASVTAAATVLDKRGFAVQLSRRDGRTYWFPNNSPMTYISIKKERTVVDKDL